ncbi:MAG: hypothetical protein JXX28_04210 [Deltaproteobacteria bacterium]|nr:hypothetical protein [Deltaproteobacteria bacterium]
MRVRIDSALLSERHSLLVLGLLALSEARGHALATELEAADAWSETLPEDLQQAVRDLLDAHRSQFVLHSASHATITVTLEDLDSQRGRLSPEDAFRLLALPLELLLENERGDWHFVRRLAQPAQRRLLDEALREGWLLPRQGGGLPELTKALKALLPPEQQPDLQRFRRLRTWVLFDRDATKTDASRPSSQSVAARKACVALSEVPDPWRFGWTRLHRRHIESFLPDVVLDAWAHDQKEDVQDTVQALLELRKTDPAQAASWNMKQRLEATIATLFETASHDPAFPAEYDRDHPDGPGAAAALIETLLERL